ncbi:MAG: hypothetical protein ABIQ81_02245 [Novosphingobium sp.]
MITHAGRTFLALIALTSLSGCIARTASSLVTAPVRVASKGVDLATTSQSEADEKRGRDLRRREERRSELDRQYRRHSQQCDRGDETACRQADRAYDELQRLSAVGPARR